MPEPAHSRRGPGPAHSRWARGPGSLEIAERFEPRPLALARPAGRLARTPGRRPPRRDAASEAARLLRVRVGEVAGLAGVFDEVVELAPAAVARFEVLPAALAHAVEVALDPF